MARWHGGVQVASVFLVACVDSDEEEARVRELALSVGLVVHRGSAQETASGILEHVSRSRAPPRS